MSAFSALFLILFYAKCCSGVLVGSPNGKTSEKKAIQWNARETLIIEDLHQYELKARADDSNRRLSEAYESFMRSMGHAPDPAVFVSVRLEGSAFLPSENEFQSKKTRGVRSILEVLPEGLASMFEPFDASEPSVTTVNDNASFGLSTFEWSMCGGRYRPTWPTVQSMSDDASTGEKNEVQKAIYRHQNHVTCGQSPVSSCYARLGGEKKKDNNIHLSDHSAIRSHHAKLMRHWGGMVGTTNGIAGSVHDVHDRYSEGVCADKESNRKGFWDMTPKGILMSASSMLRSPHYRSAAEYDAPVSSVGSPTDSPSLLSFDMGVLTSGTTSGNRLIAAHKRPQGVHGVGGGRSCFHDISTMERLCTENLLPLLYVWEEMLQADGSKTRPVKRRLQADEWSMPFDAPNRRSEVSRHLGYYPTARLSVLDVAVPDAIFVLSTGYHSLSLRLGSSKDVDGERLTFEFELTFILSTREEVHEFQRYIFEQRSQELGALAKAERKDGGSRIRLLGNAFAANKTSLRMLETPRVDKPEVDLKSQASAAEVDTKREGSADCSVDVDVVQFGEVSGELAISVFCRADIAVSSSATAVIESLLLLPAHTINPLLSSMRFETIESTRGGDGPAPHVAIVRVWYDPLSTVTSVVMRTTIVMSGAEMIKTRATIPFKFPSLRLDHYPPDMNKAYTIPQVVSRVRFAQGAGEMKTKGDDDELSLDIFHQRAVSLIMDGAEDGPQQVSEENQRVEWRYQRCRTVSTVTLPLPDPGMVFNVLSLSSAVVALLVGRGVGIVLRRSIL